jgi:hypothetical protein
VVQAELALELLVVQLDLPAQPGQPREALPYRSRTIRTKNSELKIGGIV